MKFYAKYFTLALMILASISFTACEKEEDELDELDIEFKMDAGYTFADATLAAGTEVKVGIEAETEKAKDPIIRFTVSDAVNGAASATVYTENLDNTDYEHDYIFTLQGDSGDTHLLTFTITNRDGLVKQTSLTITVQ